MNESVLHNQ